MAGPTAYNEQTLLPQEGLTSQYWNSGPFSQERGQRHTAVMNTLTKQSLLLLRESESFTVTSMAKFLMLLTASLEISLSTFVWETEGWPPKYAYVLECVNIFWYRTHYKNKLYYIVLILQIELRLLIS